MTAPKEEVKPVPAIRNVSEIGKEPELITHVHFTGVQWNRAIQGIRPLDRGISVDEFGNEGLRYERLQGSRGDVLVSPRTRGCAGKGGEDVICVPVPRGKGPRIVWECQCFPKPEKSERPPPPPIPNPPECELGYNREERRFECYSDRCENCIGAGYSRNYWSGVVICECIDLDSVIG